MSNLASGGSASVTIPEPYENIMKTEIYNKNLIANSPATFLFRANEHGIYEVVITGKENEIGVALRVDALKNISKIVTINAPGNVYKNLNINLETKRFQDAIIRFKVENSWISSNNLASGDIKMVKWDGSKWIQLETTEKSTNGSYTYYEARTIAFSSFAITGTRTEAVSSVSATAIATPVTIETKIKTPEGTTKASQSAAGEKTPGFGWIPVISAIVAVYLLGQRRR
jgi:PGF-pre-PGF domain-containing protein